MRNRILYLLLSLVLLCGGVLPTSIVEANGSSVTITTEVLNVREGPGLSFPIAQQVKKGEEYRLLKEEGDWIQISLQNGKKGWVASWLVKKKTSNQEGSFDKSKLGTVTVDSLRIRSGPGTGFQVIGSLNKGQTAEVLELNENWAKIKLLSGSGWISKQYITFTNGHTDTTNPTTPSTGVVTVNNLNVRKEPSLQGSILGKLQKGQQVQIVSLSNGWTEIKYSGRNAWTSSQYISVSKEQPDKPTNPPPTTEGGIIGTVTANSLNVREKGTLSGKVIGSVSKGDSFKIIEESNNWAKIEFKSGSYGWVAGWFLSKKADEGSAPPQPVTESSVAILHNGTNIRKGPSVGTQVVQRANQGDTFKIVSITGDWYEIVLANGTKGFVAGWIVQVKGSAPQVERPGAEKHLKGKTIVIDPGHGGRDNGATGARGTLEKELTLRTGKLLHDKLKAAGTNVILTRSNNETYLSLRSRVSTAQFHKADALISLHYDSFYDRSVRGITSYYYHSYQKPLAEKIQSAMVYETKLRDRGAMYGNFHILREINQKAVLLELGYLSNPTEETLINSSHYQEAVSTGIFNGLAHFFKEL